MRAGIDKILHESCRAAFEQLCFMYEMPELAEQQSDAAPAAATEVKYRGSFRGKLVLTVTGSLFDAIAAQMMGAAQTTLQQRQDGLGELANVICGNVLPALADSAERFIIEGPVTVRDIRDSRPLLCPPVAAAVINFDKGRADARLYLDEHS
jgi:chemotaxis protein CheY-P-specific phosphatase CheC